MISTCCGRPIRCDGDLYENYALGKDLTVTQVKEIAEIARRHGFKLAGFRSFEHAVPEVDIERIRLNAGRARQAAVSI